MSEFKDVAGQPLAVGDKVAYCISGRGTVMRIGIIDRLTAKSVAITTEEVRFMYNATTRKWDIPEKYTGEVFRLPDAVAKVFPVEVI